VAAMGGVKECSAKPSLVRAAGGVAWSGLGGCWWVGSFGGSVKISSSTRARNSPAPARGRVSVVFFMVAQPFFGWVGGGWVWCGGYGV